MNKAAVYLEYAKQTQAFIAALPPVLSNYFDILPFVNPLILDHLWVFSAVFAVSGSGVSYNVCRHSNTKALIRAAVLWFAFTIAACVLLIVVSSGVWGTSGIWLNILVRCTVFLGFVGLGCCMGSVIAGVLRPSAVQSAT